MRSRFFLDAQTGAGHAGLVTDSTAHPAATIVFAIIAERTDHADLSYRGACDKYAIMAALGIRAGQTFARSEYADALDALVAGGSVTEEITLYGVAFRAKAA